MSHLAAYGSFMSNKGVALILVIGILAVTSIMAVSFMFTMRLELTSADNYTESLRAHYLAEGAISYSEAILKEDDPSIDSFLDKWCTVFKGEDVDNDKDGVKESKWIYVYDDNKNVVGRYAVLIKDEAGFLNINTATHHNTSPLKITEGWTPYEVSLKKFLASFNLEDVDKVYEDIISFKYGFDNEPGAAGIDDNKNQRILNYDGIDNNGDGIIDEAGEGIDEPMEFDPDHTYGDDKAFSTPFELSQIKSIPEDLLHKISNSITVYSYDKNVDIKGNMRKNINLLDEEVLADVLKEGGVSDPFQKAVNIVDSLDEDFSQSVITKLYKRLSSYDKGTIGDWVWRNGFYETSFKGGSPLTISWLNVPSGEYYIGVFGKNLEKVGDVTINGIKQSSVKSGDILRFGAMSFDNNILDITITNMEDNETCYFSHIELYPKEGQLGFESVDVRGVEGIRINEIMVKPSFSKNTFSMQTPGGNWVWKNAYYENSMPNGGKEGEGVFEWSNVPNGNYYVKLFGVSEGQAVGDVEINGSTSFDILSGDLFGDGKVITVDNNKIKISIQNNRLTGATFFKSIELSQEPDGEYIELVNLTPNEVDIGGWSIEGPGEEGWPASIPIGTIIGSYGYITLCVDKDDSREELSGNGISFDSIWRESSSVELHFFKNIDRNSDLITNEVYPEGNIIVLKDTMSHIVDIVEYLPDYVIDNKSLERGDPSYVVDSNSNGIPDNWYVSEKEKGGTPSSRNDNEGMKEYIDEKEVVHNVTEILVKNKNFSSIGEICNVSSSLGEWERISLEDVSKIADKLTVFGNRLEGESHFVNEDSSGWKLTQRRAPETDYFESAKTDSIGRWKWEEIENGFYSLFVFGEEGEGFSISVRLKDDSWSEFTPSLIPGPSKGVLFGNIKIENNTLDIRIKNTSKNSSSHFDFVRLEPLSYVNGRININTASKDILKSLPGIDEKIAENIIKSRVFGNSNDMELGIGDLLLNNTLGETLPEKKEKFRMISNIITVHSDIYRIIVTSQALKKGKVSSEKKIWTVYER